MNPSPQAESAPDASLAGGMINVVQQLQRNRDRFSGARRLQGAPIGGEAREGAEVLNALRENQVNAEKENATRAPGALQGKRQEERGRERNVGQRQAQGRPGQSA